MRLRSLLLFTVISVAANATTNSMTVVDKIGTAQTNYPLQFGRFFPDQTIVNYPQVLINGSAATTQANVTQRYASGYVKHAVISVIIPSISAFAGRGVGGDPSAITLTFQNQASCNCTPETKAHMLGNYDFDATMTFSAGVTATVSARTMLNAWDGSSSSYLGPVFVWAGGSVATTIMIADHTQASTCNGVPCGANDFGADAYKSLRPVWFVTFWPGLAKAHVTHAIIEGTNPNSMQDQSYTISVTAGNTSPATVYTQSGVSHYYGARFSFDHNNQGGQTWTAWASSGNYTIPKEIWTGGAAPPPMELHHNLAYLAENKVLPNYDQTLVIPESVVAAQWSAFLNTSSSPWAMGSIGNWQSINQGTGGSHTEIGPYPDWLARWFMNWDLRGQEEGVREAMLSSSWRSYRESTAGKKFRRSLATGTATGHVVSIAGRPSAWLDSTVNDSRQDSFVPDAADRIHCLSGKTCTDNFTHGGTSSHSPEPWSIPYYLTGDLAVLENLWFWSAYDIGSAVWSWGSTNHESRGTDGTYSVGDVESTRAMAWLLREVTAATWYGPDALPETDYFRDSMTDQLSAMEGEFNITTGTYNGTTMWTWANGSRYSSSGWWNGALATLHQSNPGTSAFVQVDQCYNIDPATTSIAYSLFETDYYMYAIGRAVELGYQNTALLTYLGYFYTQMAASSDPYILQSGRYPVRNSGGSYFANPAALLLGWDATIRGYTDYNACGGNDNYSSYLQVVAALLKSNSVSGADTLWSAISPYATTLQTNATGSGAFAYVNNPKWDIIPRVATVTRTVLSSGGTYHPVTRANIQAALDASACGDTVQIEAGSVTQILADPLTFSLTCPLGSEVTLTGTTADANLPSANQRITRGYLPLLPKLTMDGLNSNSPAIAVNANGVSGLIVRGLAFENISTTSAPHWMLSIGNNDSQTVADLADNITLDRNIFLGNKAPAAASDFSSAFQANAKRTIITNNWIDRYHSTTFTGANNESWAGLWTNNTTGPTTVRRNYSGDGIGEHWFFGGNNGSVFGPSQHIDGVTLEQNVTHNSLKWYHGTRTHLTDMGGGGIVCMKNFFEWKQGRNITARWNTGENMWGVCGSQWYAFDLTLRKIAYSSAGDMNGTLTLSGGGANLAIAGATGSYNLKGPNTAICLPYGTFSYSEWECHIITTANNVTEPKTYTFSTPFTVATCAGCTGYLWVIYPNADIGPASVYGNVFRNVAQTALILGAEDRGYLGAAYSTPGVGDTHDVDVYDNLTLNNESQMHIEQEGLSLGSYILGVQLSDGGTRIKYRHNTAWIGPNATGLAATDGVQLFINQNTTGLTSGDFQFINNLIPNNGINGATSFTNPGNSSNSAIGWAAVTSGSSLFQNNQLGGVDQYSQGYYTQGGLSNACLNASYCGNFFGYNDGGWVFTPGFADTAHNDFTVQAMSSTISSCAGTPLVTCTTTAPHGLTDGQLITIAGTGCAGTYYIHPITSTTMTLAGTNFNESYPCTQTGGTVKNAYYHAGTDGASLGVNMDNVAAIHLSISTTGVFSYTLPTPLATEIGTLEVSQTRVIGATQFVGVGANNGTFAGTYTGQGTNTYQAIPDGLGTPNTFKWRKNSGAYTTGVAMTGSAQTLVDGITITFASTTGHSLGDSWSADGTYCLTSDLCDSFTLLSIVDPVVTARADSDVANTHTTGSGTGTRTFDLSTAVTNGQAYAYRLLVGGGMETGVFTAGPAEVCSDMALTPSSATAVEGGATGTFDVSVTGAGCNRNVVASGGASCTANCTGTGSVSGVGWSMPPNTGAIRTGTLLVGGVTFNIVQDAGTVTLPAVRTRLLGSTIQDGKLK